MNPADITDLEATVAEALIFAATTGADQLRNERWAIAEAIQTGKVRLVQTTKGAQP